MKELSELGYRFGCCFIVLDVTALVFTQIVNMRQTGPWETDWVVISSSGTLRQGSRDAFQEKMFQDLKTVSITQSSHYLLVSETMVSFNPKPLKFRDFSVLSATEHAQIVWKLQRQFRKGKQQPWPEQNLHSVLAWNM